MSAKVDAPGPNKTDAKPQHSQAESQDFQVAYEPIPIFRNGQIDPRTLTPSAILHLQRTIGNQAVSNLLTGVRIQRAINPGLTVNHTENAGRAARVRVEGVSGKPYGEGANPPSADPTGWQELRNAGHTLSVNMPGVTNSHYNAVRMHLWNGRLGGPGHQTWNLAPGPAQANSEMSAGPEQAAKDAVSAGGTIWQETRVTYANDTVNANDFTSTIARRFEMEWGYMNAGVAGPRVGNLWTKNIDQPVGALTPLQQDEFKKWKDADWAALQVKLAASALQVKVQAYALVGNSLKKRILDAFPEVYLGMADAEKSTYLMTLTDPAVNTFFTNKLHKNTASEYITYIVFPLINTGQSAKVQTLFAAQPAAFQQQLIEEGGWDLLQHLSPAIIQTFAKQWRVFNMLPQASQYAQLNTMTAPEIAVLVTAMGHGSFTGDVKELFDRWAESNVGVDPHNWVPFIKAHVTGVLGNTYELRMRNTLYAHDNPPPTTRGKKAKIGP